MNNTNVKFWFNLEDHGAGRIFVTIAGKKRPLRYTVYQQEQLSALLETRCLPAESVKSDEKDPVSEASEPANTSMLARSYKQDIDICSIALNPEPNKIDFTREDIETNLDIDQVKLIAGFWMSKKVFSPTMTGEPAQGK
jgi:hypothetical protein